MKKINNLNAAIEIDEKNQVYFKIIIHISIFQNSHQKKMMKKFSGFKLDSQRN